MPDLLAHVLHRQVDRLLQQGPRHLALQLCHHGTVIALPVGEQFAVVVEDLGLGHLFGRGDQRQCLVGGGAVVEHHRRFHGVVDGAGDQVQVVVGIDARGHPEQGHQDPGQAGGEQGNAQVATAQHRAQGRPGQALARAAHGCAARRRDNCSTLWMRTPLRATESRLTSKATCCR
jgi:hypothetical protein